MTLRVKKCAPRISQASDSWARRCQLPASRTALAGHRSVAIASDHWQQASECWVVQSTSVQPAGVITSPNVVLPPAVAAVQFSQL